MNQFIIGTAGHIDHGKTALVKALTGVDTDRLEEEKARGMTIDIGFAFLNDTITIIDVPGHEKFIRNMVAGVSTIHFGLLVIAGDDGIMPQTLEHLQIMQLMGINNGAIALTKIDSVDDAEWLDLVETDIQETVQGTFLENSKIFRTSIHDQDSINQLKTYLVSQKSDIDQNLGRGFFRLPVDRVFTKTGFGLVVTGSVISGKIATGDEIEIFPGGGVGKVRGLQSHGIPTDSVKMGDRAAVNITGVDKSKLFRGSEITQKNHLVMTNRLVGHVELIKGTKWKLKRNQRFHLHKGTEAVLGKVIYVHKKMKAGDQSNLIIETESPISCAMDDRFLIRSYSPMETIGGGIILDPSPNQKMSALKKAIHELSKDRGKRLKYFIAANRKTPITLIEWARRFSCRPEEIQGLLGSEIIIRKDHDDLIYFPEDLKSSEQDIVQLLKDFHLAEPLRESANKEQIKSKSGFSQKWFQLVMDELLKAGEIEVINHGLALKKHSVKLSKNDEKLVMQIKQFFTRDDLVPKSANEIFKLIKASEQQILALLHVLKSKNELIDLDHDFWMINTGFQDLKQKLLDHFKQNPTLSVAQFKEITGTTRKTAIPLLEYLDSVTFTQRTGQDRTQGEALS